MSIRVLLVDDHCIVREGIRALIAAEPEVEVVGEADNGRQAVQLARELAPDVVIMDISMRGLNGVEATRQIISASAGVKVLALSMHSDRSFVAQMLRAGASGYLQKGCSFEELMRGVRVVAANETYLSPVIARMVAEDYVRQLSKAETSLLATLTPKEREVLQLLAEGNTTKQIAAALEVSRKTVTTHRRNIMQKLNVYNAAELTKYAIREGLTSLEV